jgi:hypothetical protein
VVVVLTVAAIGGWLLLRPSGHTAAAGPAPATAQGDPVPGPNHARLMRMLPSGYSPGSCEPAATPPRALAKTVCTHNGDQLAPRRQPTHLSPTKLRYGRFSTISCAAQPSSRALETFSRPDPGAATPRPSKSAARWCAANAVDRRSIPPFASVGRSADGLGEAADVSQTGRVDLGPRSRAEPTRVDCLPKQQFPLLDETTRMCC